MAHTVASVVIGDITIGQTGAYTIAQDSLGDVAQTWRYGAVSSPWVHGAFLVNATLDQGTLALTATVTGTTVGDLITKISALRTELQEFSYQVTVTVGATSTTWSAWPGSVALAGGSWQDDRLRHFHQRVNLSIPVYPVPVS